MIKRTTKLKTNTRSRATKTAPERTESAPQLSPSAAPIQFESAKPAPTPTPAAKIEVPKPASTKAVSPAAHLELIKPEAKSVCVAGSFNGWNPARNPLTRRSDGKWVGDLTGVSGRHEYLFVVDGQWLPDPNAKETVQNPFGGRNSVLVVSE